MANSSSLNFEINLAGLFNVSDAEVFLYELADAGGSFPSSGPFAPGTSNMIVQTDQDLELKLKWKVTGSLPLMMSGTWKCTVYLDKIGVENRDAAGNIVGDGPFTKTTPLVSSLSKEYELKVDIPAIANEGLYKMVVALTLAGPGGDLLPIAAFSDMGLINVYKVA